MEPLVLYGVFKKRTEDSEAMKKVVSFAGCYKIDGSWLDCGFCKSPIKHRMVSSVNLGTKFTCMDAN